MSVEFKIISHRGCVNGQDASIENVPSHIEYVINKYEWIFVEIDLWSIHDNLFLGHDEPKYMIDSKFLLSDRFYVHAKNEDALIYVHKNNIKNFFFHDRDEFTITSRGEIWCNKFKWMENSILNQVNVDTVLDFKKYSGICTDYPLNVFKKINKKDNVNWPFDIY